MAFSKSVDLSVDLRQKPSIFQPLPRQIKKPTNRLVVGFSDVVGVTGFDLHPGSGQVAALTAHRAVIHYRSRSNPILLFPFS